MRRRRSTSPFARVLGILLMIPGLLPIPLPRIDFHVIRHLHGEGEVCPKHDHLLRWHPLAGEGEGVAVLHWHWLLPGMRDSSGPASETGRSIPAVHADDGDPNNHLDPTSGPSFVQDATDPGGRGAIASAHGPARSLAFWIAPPPPSPSPFGPAPRALSDGLPPHAAMARLVRWNC